MRLNVYTIFDTATGAYMRPFYMQSDGQATRAFKDLAVAADHEIGKHPEDYSLWRIGQFNDNKGELVPEDRECLATALELVATAQRVDQDKMEELNGEINAFSNGA
jgi:hypothetical protein